MTNTELLKSAITASIEAGKEILDVYSGEIGVKLKEDESPLTLADQRAHNKIMEFLKPLAIPVLSEEGKEIPFEERKNWNRLWIVDPLDGTKEFIKKNGEFTVNIALIENGFPLLGVIYVPVSSILYFASGKLGSRKVNAAQINCSDENWFDQLLGFSTLLPSEKQDPQRVRIVASRSHMSPETEAFIAGQEKQSGAVELVSMGSSLKICLVAEGKADIYPRFAPTMEWDTAAGQAIAECAGKSFINYKTGRRMEYNRENLRNDWFLVS